MHFAYTGSIFWDEVNNLIDLIKDADFFGIDDIKEEGIKILASELSLSNAIEAYYLSDTYSSTLLKDKSRKFILDNFDVLSDTSAFLKLTTNSFKDILSNNSSTSCVEKIFEGFLRWIAADLERRKSCFIEIFELTQFCRIDAHKIIKIATNEKTLSGSLQHK